MKIQLQSFSNEGGRSQNEDSLTTYMVSDYCLALLCDGLGGHGGGEIASQAAVDSFSERVQQELIFEDEDILDAIYGANQAVMDKQKENVGLEKMRTTLTGCVISHEELKCFHVGDTRFYFFRDGAVSFLTKDHSMPQVAVDMGELSFNKIRNHSDRNRLTKVLGSSEAEHLNLEFPSFRLAPGDAFLLGTDGFWEYITETEMEFDLAKSENPKKWIDFMLVRLLLRAKEGHDNFSVIAGMVE